MWKLTLLGTAALLLLLAQLRLALAQAAAAAADNSKCPLRSEDLKYWDWTPLRTACDPSSQDFCTSCACAVATTSWSGFDRAGVLINGLRLRELNDETWRAVVDSCSSILTIEVSEVGCDVTYCRLLCCAGLWRGSPSSKPAAGETATAPATAAAPAAAAKAGSCPLSPENLSFWDWTSLRTACGPQAGRAQIFCPSGVRVSDLSDQALDDLLDKCGEVLADEMLKELGRSLASTLNSCPDDIFEAGRKAQCSAAGTQGPGDATATPAAASGVPTSAATNLTEGAATPAAAAARSSTDAAASLAANPAAEGQADPAAAAAAPAPAKAGGSQLTPGEIAGCTRPCQCNLVSSIRSAGVWHLALVPSSSEDPGKA
uniref:Pherophorin domain-containing protein n=1 Tax=Tetradesmus obliquus TaxID=3088 RepID=A0A383WBM5_TETOB|eukprot:jgi/Sobl393_1/11126/SZX74633.1